MRRTWVAAALLLAACSRGGEPADNGAGASAAVEPTPSNLTADPQNSIVPVPVPTPVPLSAIPAAFQGRWGLVDQDCNPARADAKGLLTIAGDRLSFYESRGSAGHIRQTRPAQIAFDLPMSGEGMTWSEPTVLTLIDDGRTLLREAKGSPDRAGAFRYSRCPS